MIWWILMFAAIFLLCSNGEFKKQAFRVLDGAMREATQPAPTAAAKRAYISPFTKKTNCRETEMEVRGIW